ncbi:uncharacterized protein LOC112493893 [Cephus cinctus]|uniref:Uncharacterized protein LOC112493893 n=1 Tax=Cephus cinctus TaxID=211228 RepID=A0AAJ7VY73_CEPCN|nr:uncharacterized protein LOC112493893 [Cephus cinctus]
MPQQLLLSLDAIQIFYSITLSAISCGQIACVQRTVYVYSALHTGDLPAGYCGERNRIKNLDGVQRQKQLLRHLGKGKDARNFPVAGRDHFLILKDLGSAWICLDLLDLLPIRSAGVLGNTQDDQAQGGFTMATTNYSCLPCI